MNLPEPKVIWEIGSRDGREAQRLSDAFPESQVIAFEPNPETFPLVKAVALKNPKITPKNLAISNTNGSIDFHKINTAETVTSWVDGNPGASSLLRSSGNYPYEKCVQDLIKVRSMRAADFLKEEPELQPQLLWIDVQGSEDQVLESFQSDLREVHTIVVELSLKEIYLNQPLALEVIELIKNKFYFAGVLNVGEWQFDALLINKQAPKKVKHWLSDKYFRFSLKSDRKFGIARSFPRASDLSKWLIGKCLRLATDRIVNLLNSKDRSHPNLLHQVFLRTTNSNSNKLAHSSRRLAEASLPSNPLKHAGVIPEISLLIPVISKDSSRVNLVIKNILQYSLNPISCITIVYGGEKPLIDEIPNVVIRIAHESDYIPASLEVLIEKYVQGRRGWVRQQVIKFLGAGKADTNATLVCDSDTYLLQKRLWLDENGVQQLQICHEFSDEYEKHYLDFFGRISILPGKVSFVTHHQLMQKRIIQEMFGVNLDGIAAWLKLGNFESSSPISEYHTYGRFLSERHPEKYRFARWNNLHLEAGNEDLASLIEDYAQSYSSVSIHKY
jgi:FkbM family methyltransferase